jgi:hypothetical protein
MKLIVIHSKVSYPVIDTYDVGLYQVPVHSVARVPGGCLIYLVHFMSSNHCVCCVGPRFTYDYILLF